MTGDRQPAIVAEGLCKSYGEVQVLVDVDLRVPEGTVFALLGPNGAGKTTVVRILSTLISADRGTAWVAGHDVAGDADGVRTTIGVTGQFSVLDELLTGEENLRLMADLNHLGAASGRSRVSGLLDRFELAEVARRPVATYSGGMKRRLDLAMTLVGTPTVIFLDEPTTGLDPRSRRMMWTIIRDLVAGGVTIFLTTQYLEEADQLADRVAVLDQGKLVAEGSPDDLKRRIPGAHVQLQFAQPQDLESAARLLGTGSQDSARLTLHIPTSGEVSSLRHLLDQIDDARIVTSQVSIHTPDLDDVFFAVTGHSASRDGASR